MKEEKMFEMYKSAFSDFEPEVPAHVYQGVRKRMQRSGFWSFSASSFNVYYLALILGIGGVVLTMTGEEEPVLAETLETKSQSHSLMAKPFASIADRDLEKDVSDDMTITFQSAMSTSQSKPQRSADPSPVVSDPITEPIAEITPKMECEKVEEVASIDPKQIELPLHIRELKEVKGSIYESLHSGDDKIVLEIFSTRTKGQEDK